MPPKYGTSTVSKDGNAGGKYPTPLVAKNVMKADESIGKWVPAAVGNHHGLTTVTITDDAGLRLVQGLTCRTHEVGNAEQLVIGVKEIQIP